ncbi:MAG: hypothetical protein M1281_02825 [Chloroflexi bacterium]|nr:hypothetical protein [Chloroflexota bacterium]
MTEEMVPCPDCGGQGYTLLVFDAEGHDYPAICWTCNGTGEISEDGAKCLTQLST